jgi:adenylate kinase
MGKLTETISYLEIKPSEYFSKVNKDNFVFIELSPKLKILRKELKLYK